MSEPGAKPRLSDAEMLARFQDSKKRPPCSQTLRMRLSEVDQEAKRLRMDFDVSTTFCNATGAVQGGFIAAMMDEAMSTCCIIASNITMSAPTLEMKTSYLRRLMPGHAYVDARIVKWGRSVAFMEADCYDSGDRLVAKATATALPMLFKKLG